jgi:thioredoxin-related protein
MSSASKRVSLLYFVQMGCPACAAEALPQAAAVHRLFTEVQVSAVHAACDPVAFQAYVAEHAPGVCALVDDELFQRYSIQATPTIVLLDRAGRLRRRTAGRLADLLLGAELMSLLREDRS